jgi:hypothetical protein
MYKIQTVIQNMFFIHIRKGDTSLNITENELWHAKHLFLHDSQTIGFKDATHWTEYQKIIEIDFFPQV